MEIQNDDKFIEFLSPFISDHKKERIDEVLAQRTKYVTIVLEDIFQSHNASAVVRSCECLGVQDIHIIEKRNKYQVNKDVLSGAGKWVNLNRYESEHPTRDCFENLRERGYKIIGATPESSYDIHELPINSKLAIVFGTELAGLTEYALDNVDETVKIPMVGFTESFNLSVSAALITYNLVARVRKELERETWQLPEEEKIQIKSQWYLNSVKNPDKLEREFLRLNPEA